jgi:hypothetical protein
MGKTNHKLFQRKQSHMQDPCKQEAMRGGCPRYTLHTELAARSTVLLQGLTVAGILKNSLLRTKKVQDIKQWIVILWLNWGTKKQQQTPWSESASELYRPSDRRFSARGRILKSLA